MSKQKPQFQTIDEYCTIAKAIIEKYPEVFGGIQADELRGVAITNKQAPQEFDKRWTVKSVPYPIRLDCPYSYYVIFFKDHWEGLNSKMKSMFVAQTLNAIPTSSQDEGKIISRDFKDYKILVKTFGVEYQQNPNIPDILKEDVKWKLN